MTDARTDREAVDRLTKQMVTWPGQGVYAADLMRSLLARAENAEARADHAPALVAEAYELAGDAAADAYDAGDLPSGSDMAGFIRSLTPSDALAALEARDKRVRREALRDAASHFIEQDISDEILALIEGDQTDEW